jgi:predicted CXXCH cytochrome family protein
VKKKSDCTIDINIDFLFLLPLLIGSLMVLILTAFPADVSAAGPPDQACQSCHVSGQLGEFTLPSGETLSLAVDIDPLAQSIHGQHLEEPLFCTDCHQSRERYLYPHQPNPAQTRQEFAADVSQACRDCHRPIEKHNPGHLMALDNPNLPTCTDCHTGGHAMASAAPLAGDITATCRGCHQTFEDPQLADVHQELMANLGSGQSCQTCHNDEPVYPADVQCKACHGLLTSDMVFESGETVSLHMEAEELAGSVHGRHLSDQFDYTPLLCTDCHRQQARYGFPHEPINAPTARSFSIEMSDLCQECHQDIYDRQQDSTHAMALAEGNMDAATCADCHGSHVIPEPDEPRERISQTCARCHSTINEEYATSVHGAALLGEANPDVPVCIDCHGVHDIHDPTTALFRVRSPRLCANCHADEGLMGQYGISTDVFDTYVADFHGTTVELFEKQSPDHETNKAVCYDCHSVHNILPPNDENSQVIKQNLLETCRQCHPDASANFPDAWTSHFEPSPQNNPLIYLVNLFYAILIPLTIGGFLLFIFSDVFRRVRNFWRRDKEVTS